jgi:hypothetical protein
MKYLLFLSLFLFFSCKSGKDLGNISSPASAPEPVVLNLDYEGETLHAMQIGIVNQAQMKVVAPEGKVNPRTLLYIAEPGEPITLYKNLPYDGEEIPAIHIDNATFDKIRSTKGVFVVPKVIDDK